jgi:hypothetical protein
MYDAGIRREALDLVESGLSLNAVGKRLGISRSAIREWQARSDSVDVSTGCPAPAPASADYSALLGFYLGDGCISRHPRTWSLRIS